MSTNQVVGTELDAYVAELDSSLRGPRRLKRDLMAEVRDSLTDAAEAYEGAGLDDMDARRRALADFGDVAEIAPGYQTELGVAQSRRTAVTILAVLFLQVLGWDRTWPWLPDQPPSAPNGSAVNAVDVVVERLGAVWLLAAIAVLVGGRLWARRPRTGARVVRAAGALGWLVGAHVVVSFAVFNAVSPSTPQTPVVTIAVPFALIVLLPVAWMVRSSRRCFAMA